MSLVNTTDIALSTFALVSALTTVLSDEGSVQCCAEGWLELVRGRCYYANDTSSVSWRQANDTCRSMNAVLAYPSNNDEQHLLQEYISTRWGYQTVHIGIYYDRYFKQWRNADNVRSLEKPNSDKTSKGDWCSSLVPYPWNDKSEFIMQIVDCNAVKAPFICQTGKCMQCNKRPCEDYYDYLPESDIQVTQPIQKRTTMAAARQGNVAPRASSTQATTTKNTLTTAVFSKLGTQMTSTSTTATTISPSTANRTVFSKLGTPTTSTSTIATTISPSTANRTIVHVRLICASILYSFLFQ